MGERPIIVLVTSAFLLNILIVVLNVCPAATAKQIVASTTSDLGHIDSSFGNPAKIRELASKVDLLIVEVGHIVLKELQRPWRR